MQHRKSSSSKKNFFDKMEKVELRYHHVNPLPRLPIIHIGNSEDYFKYSLWYRYLQHVYGYQDARYDLNEFSWFYWMAPTNISAVQLNDCFDDVVPFDVPWIGGPKAWLWGPEHMTRRLGYFVHRNISRPHMVLVEVMRFGPNALVASFEKKNTYHFHTIGSGIFWHESYKVQQSCNSFIELTTTHSHSDDFWGYGRYSMENNRTCTLMVSFTKLLMCEEMNITLFPLNMLTSPTLPSDTRSDIWLWTFVSISFCVLASVCLRNCKRKREYKRWWSTLNRFSEVEINSTGTSTI